MVFDKFRGYGFVHHRALNDHAAYTLSLRNVAAYPERTHILEGDLCWDFSPGRELFYFRHPSYVIDTLPADEVVRGLEGDQLVGLMHLDKVKPTGAFLAIELKVGRGDWRQALTRLLAYLEENFAGRYWIDGFSLPMLKFVKDLCPSAPVTLHTELVFRGYVLIGAPEFPPFRIRKIACLDWIDGIAIRRHGSEAFMERACRDVLEAGKVLVLSRLHSLHEFARSKAWRAAAGYMHWDFKELIEYNDALDAKAPLAVAKEKM